MVEPDNHGRYRMTPVTFMDGGSSASPEQIRRLMNLITENAKEANTDSFTKEFLWIHPFSDGNGRTGWLLHNWHKGSLNNPVELPKYFGEWPFNTPLIAHVSHSEGFLEVIWGMEPLK